MKFNKAQPSRVADNRLLAHLSWRRSNSRTHRRFAGRGWPARLLSLWVAMTMLLGLWPAPTLVLADPAPVAAEAVETVYGPAEGPLLGAMAQPTLSDPAVSVAVPVLFPQPNVNRPRLPLRPLQAAGNCANATALDMQITPPAYIISMGNVDGDVYTVTVTNNGAKDVTEVSFLINPNVGFSYLDNSATVMSSVDGSLAFDTDTTGAPDANATIELTGVTTQTTLAQSETLIFVFKLATNADAKSGQRLEVTLQSGDPVAECKTAMQNLQTARGNLVVTKKPTLQDARVGEAVTWTVEMRNSGMGNVYSATLTDIPGSGLANVNVVPSLSAIEMAPEATQLYTVTAVVDACTNLTNTVAATWPTGNADGSGTLGNPAHDEVDVVLLLDTPDVAVEVGSLPQVDYCGALDTTIPVTVTNTGGMGRKLRLNLSASGVNVSAPSGWSQTGDVLIYEGGTVFTDAIGTGERLTLSVPITATDACISTTASLGFTPVVELACLEQDAQGTSATSAQPFAQDAPTLAASIYGAPHTAIAGDSFTYVVNVTGTLQEQIEDAGLTLIDTVANRLVIDNYTFSAGNVEQDGQALTWNLPLAGNGAYTEQLTITVTVPDNNVCNASGNVRNRLTATAEVCPECTLTTTVTSEPTYIMDTLSPSNTFSLAASPIQVCAPATSQQWVTATLAVGSGITWTGSVYTDTLGRESLLLPLDVDTTTLQVFIDDVDRTADVIITLVTDTLASAALTLDFRNIGTYSTTTNITITYQVAARAASIPEDGAIIQPFIFAEFELNGPAQACDGDLVGYVGTDWHIERGDLSVAVAPAILDSCQENTITLTVTGGDADTRTDNVVVTFTAQAGDVFTPTNPTLGGAFHGQVLTVTKTDNVVIFTFDSVLNLDAAGTISFPLYRACGNTESLSATVQYQDLCDTSRTASATGGETSRSSNVNIFVTPQAALLNEREARWRFYVNNTGALPATPIITNTLPAGYVFYTYTVTSPTPSVVSGITLVTKTVGSYQVLTFTVPNLTQGQQVQFDVYSQIDACQEISTVDIRLKQACGQVAGVCGDSAGSESAIEFTAGSVSINSSNDQTTGLPLCETGIVQLLVKNTSSQSQIYGITITEIITNGSFITGTTRVTVTNQAGDVVTGTTSGALLENIPFTPISSTLGSTQILTWSVDAFTSGSAAYDVLVQRDASDLILLAFGMQTGCAGLEAQAQSGGSVRDVCNNGFAFKEDSQTLVVDAPELTVVKTGCNESIGDCTDPSKFDHEVAAGENEIVVWKIDVLNEGRQDAFNLFVNDTFPDNFTITEVHPMTTSMGGARVLQWEITGTLANPVLAIDAQKTFYITGTVNDAGCTDNKLITATARFGCEATDNFCSSMAVLSDTATLLSQPDIKLTLNRININQCTGSVIVKIENKGAPAKDVVISYTLPSNIAYSSFNINRSKPIAPDLTPRPAMNATGTITWSYVALTGTTELRFNVKNAVGICPATGTLTATANGKYVNSCDNISNVATVTNTVTVRKPLIVGNLAGDLISLALSRRGAAEGTIKRQWYWGRWLFGISGTLVLTTSLTPSSRPQLPILWRVLMNWI